MPWNSLIGNWIINLSVLLCNLNIIISQHCENHSDTPADNNMPADWPCEWYSGRIPFVYNFFSLSPRNRNRLTSLVRSAHTFLEARSCLTFEEQNPLTIVQSTNVTYIYYVFTAALEDCCLKFYKKPTGRRMVLIAPICRMPDEIAHAILHGMGIIHAKREQFNEHAVNSVLFSNDCENKDQKLRTLIDNTY